MAEVVLDGVTKRYQTGSPKAKAHLPNSGNRISTGEDLVGFGVEELSLHVADREFLVLVGPSGCGK
ncbi:MAG: hypothetical protein ACKO81_00695, partial [Planctomycetota bacterium]